MTSLEEGSSTGKVPAAPPKKKAFIARSAPYALGPVGLVEFLSDMLAAIVLFFSIQLNYLSIVVMSITVLTTAFYTYYHDGRHLVTRLDFSLFSFAIVFPIVSMHTSAYKRREDALDCLSRIKAEALMIHLAHRDWPWTVPVPQYLPDDHAKNVQRVLLFLMDEILNYLMTPLIYVRDYTFFPRHVAGVEWTRDYYSMNIAGAVKKLHRATETLKRCGLNGAESQRLNGYIEALTTNLERLKTFKEYRNPQGIRIFSRFFLLVYPFLYGSYYGFIARETNFALGVCLALLGSVALCAILNEGLCLEDPYLPSRTFRINDIRVRREIENCKEHLALDDTQIECRITFDAVTSLESRVTAEVQRNAGIRRDLQQKSRSHFADLLNAAAEGNQKVDLVADIAPSGPSFGGGLWKGIRSVDEENGALPIKAPGPSSFGGDGGYRDMSTGAKVGPPSSPSNFIFPHMGVHQVDRDDGSRPPMMTWSLSSPGPKSDVDVGFGRVRSRGVGAAGGPGDRAVGQAQAVPMTAVAQEEAAAGSATQQQWQRAKSEGKGPAGNIDEHGSGGV